MAKAKIEDMELEAPTKNVKTAVASDEEVIETEVSGNSAVAVRGASAVASLNTGFEGIATIANFMPYFILDGTELLNKVSEESHKTIEVVITGGKPVWQLWNMEQALVAESSDGVTSTDGVNMQQALAETKAKYPGQEEKIKIQGRYDLYFDWDYPEDGSKLTKISLSPSSKYAFSAYSQDLAKQGLGVDKVTTCIGAKRTVSKQGYRYSLATFEQA